MRRSVCQLPSNPHGTESWALVRDGLWTTPEGSRIAKVNPRGGLTLYAVTLVGMRRPAYLDTLAEAKRYKGGDRGHQ